MRIITIEVDDWDSYDIGDKIDFVVVGGQASAQVITATVGKKESLSRFTDGVYSGRPAKLTLR